MPNNPDEGEVLLLEDQALIALYVEELLQQEGFDQIVTVTSSAQALAWLSRNTPRLAVIETRVHDGDCSEVARVLKAHRIPFIVHTARMHDGNDEEPARVEMSEIWLSKPCAPEDFVAAIRFCSGAVA